MSKPTGIPTVAEAIVPHLPELLGEQAHAIDTQLQALFARVSNGEQVEVEIIDLLGSHEATRSWMNKRLSGAQEAATKGVGTLGYSELSGNRGQVKGTKYYKCPQATDHYQWTKTMDWQSPPKCPEHDCDLIEDT